jgi:two-component system chemotaxis response regulator CheY
MEIYMKVLVVDDDVVSRMVLMHLVDSCGHFDIVEAEDGAEAWELLEAGLRPAICFCDLRMPRLSGLQLLEKIKGGDAALQATPFILVSSASDRETVETATRSGAAGYVVKPFQPDSVRAHLDPFIEQAASAAHLTAEAPLATQQRLGIDGTRLVLYLTGFERQLDTGRAEIERLLAEGAQADAGLRLQRLQAGCETLGLTGAAAAIASLAGLLAIAPVQAVLADVVRCVLHQTALVQRDLL